MVATHRGFAFGDFAIESHNEWIIRTYNQVVKPGDIVYIVGDLSLSNWTRTLELCDQLNGDKRLIAGNHDAVWTQHRNWRRWIKPTLEVFESVSMWEQVNLNGVKVNISHLPYAGHNREGDERYADVRLTGPTPLIHAHTHNTLKAHDNMYHVGWDAHHKPVSESQIVKEWDAISQPR
jgi:calcineurin-like phosphoesterase family protein